MKKLITCLCLLAGCSSTDRITALEDSTKRLEVTIQDQIQDLANLRDTTRGVEKASLSKERAHNQAIYSHESDIAELREQTIFLQEQTDALKSNIRAYGSHQTDSTADIQSKLEELTEHCKAINEGLMEVNSTAVQAQRDMREHIEKCKVKQY